MSHGKCHIFSKDLSYTTCKIKSVMKKNKKKIKKKIFITFLWNHDFSKDLSYIRVMYGRLKKFLRLAKKF